MKSCTTVLAEANTYTQKGPCALENLISYHDCKNM